EVIAVGNHIIILLNGKKVVDYVDKENRHRRGHFALQQHGAWKDPKSGQVYETVLRVRKVEVMVLPPTKGAKGAEKTGTVSGTVRYKGLPLPGGTVTFHHEKGVRVSAPLNREGKFTADEVPVGQARVTIETESLRPAVKKGPGEKFGGTKDKALPGK